MSLACVDQGQAEYGSGAAVADIESWSNSRSICSGARGESRGNSECLVHRVPFIEVPYSATSASGCFGQNSLAILIKKPSLKKGRVSAPSRARLSLAPTIAGS